MSNIPQGSSYHRRPNRKVFDYEEDEKSEAPIKQPQQCLASNTRNIKRKRRSSLRQIHFDDGPNPLQVIYHKKQSSNLEKKAPNKCETIYEVTGENYSAEKPKLQLKPQIKYIPEFKEELEQPSNQQLMKEYHFKPYHPRKIERRRSDASNYIKRETIEVQILEKEETEKNEGDDKDMRDRDQIYDDHQQFQVQRNNYVLEEMQNQEVIVERTNKFGIKVIAGFILLGIVGVAIFLALHFTSQNSKINPSDDSDHTIHYHDQPQPIPPQPAPTQPTHTQPTHTQPTHVEPVALKRQRIVEREHKKNSASIVQYSIINEMSQDYSVRINYTSIFVVLGQSQDQDNQTIINFAASIQKTTEEKLTANGTVENLQVYDNSSFYEQILKDGIDLSDNDTTSENTNDTEQQALEYQLSCEQLREEMNDTSMKCIEPVLTVFDFGLYQNGKIQELTFPQKIQKQELALLRTFVKMFSPLLDYSLYQSQEPRVKLKSIPSNSMHRNQQQADNQTDNFYQEQQNYHSHEDDNSIILQNQGNIDSQGDTHSTNQQTSQVNKFSKNGKLLSGSLESETSFMPADDNEETNNTQDSDVLYSPQSTNIDQNITSHQECIMEVIEQFEAKQENVEQFKGLLESYRQKNETMTVDVEGLINYVIGISKDEQIKPGGYRLLLQEDGSLSIIKYDKKIKIFGTNVIGFKIGAFGYVKLNLNLYQDPKDKYKKNPIFKFNTGTILVLGSSNFPFELIDYEKDLPPLTLKYTLTQIQNVMDVVKGGFIKEIIQIGKMARDGNFEDMVPLLLEAASTVQSLSGSLGLQIDKISPINTLNKAYELINKLHEAYQSKGLSLLDSENGIINNHTIQIFKYLNKTYEQALQVFEETKSVLSGLKFEGYDYFSSMKSQFLANNITSITQQIESLIPVQIQQKYQEELKKAEIILKTIQYVVDEGKNYRSILTGILDNHQENLLGLVQNVMELYFKNQSLITDPLPGSIQGYVSQQAQQIQSFKNKLSYVNSVNNTVVQYFHSVVSSAQELGNINYLNQFNSLLTTITNQANAARNQRKTDCCRTKKIWYTFWTRTKCVQHNNGQDLQYKQPQTWAQTKNTIYGIFSNAINGGRDFISAATNMLNNPNIRIEDKYTQIQTLFAEHINKNPLNADSLVSAIDGNIQFAQQTYNNVNCGSKGNLGNLINSLKSLKNFILSYDGIRNNALSGYDNQLKQFSLEVFIKINVYSTISPSVDPLFQNFKSYVNNLTAIFNQLKTIQSNFASADFVASPQLSQQIFSIYQQLINTLNQPCANTNSTIQNIQNIRKQYLDHYNEISGWSNGPLASDLAKTKQFLLDGSNNMLKIYQQVPFCSIYNNFKAQIEKLYPDFHNFTVLFEIWSDFQKLHNKALGDLDQIQSQYEHLTGSFYQLYDASGYINFIKGISELADKFKNMVYDISLDLTEMRQKSGEIMIFEMASHDQLQAAVQKFENTPFNFSISQVYPDLDQMSQSSMNIIKTLNFDIITIYVAGTNIQQYFNHSIANFKSGIEHGKSEFIDACQNFLDLNKSATQEYLNKINTNFHNIEVMLNSTIFPNISEGIQAIQNKFKGYEFESETLEKIYNDQMEVLGKIGTLMSTAQDKIFKEVQNLLEKIMKLIEKLEISSLNTLHELANSIKDQIDHIVSIFKGVIGKILGFPQKVKEDFNNVFKFSDFIKDIKDEVIEQLKQANRTLTNSIKKAISELAENTKFYQKIRNSSIFQFLQTLQINGINLNIEQIWSSDQANQQLSQIQAQLNNISQGLQNQLAKLNDARQRVKDVKKSVENRIKIIRFNLQQIKRKVFNLKQLIFRVLEHDLGDVIMGGVKNISYQVDSIVNVDFSSIGDIAQQDFNLPQITSLVNKCVGFYDKIKPKKDELVGKMDKLMIKVDKFLADKVTSKIQKLKTGILFIKSQSNIEDPQQSFTLYQKQLFSRREPIAQYSQLIPTVIGTFSIDFHLNYSLSAKVYVQLHHFRDIDISANFSASLIIDITFGYGIAHILQFGIFASGNILRADVMPKFQLQNVLPVQLIDAIAQIPELSQSNVVSVYFITDLALYAVELDVGFYLEHIWIELVWKDFKFCINLIFKKFCLSLRLPIGIKFTSKKKEWGKSIKGVTLAQKRILDLKLLEFKV